MKFFAWILLVSWFAGIGFSTPLAAEPYPTPIPVTVLPFAARAGESQTCHSSNDMPAGFVTSDKGYVLGFLGFPFEVMAILL